MSKCAALRPFSPKPVLLTCVRRRKSSGSSGAGDGAVADGEGGEAAAAGDSVHGDAGEGWVATRSSSRRYRSRVRLRWSWEDGEAGTGGIRPRPFRFHCRNPLLGRRRRKALRGCRREEHLPPASLRRCCRRRRNCRYRARKRVRECRNSNCCPLAPQPAKRNRNGQNMRGGCKNCGELAVRAISLRVLFRRI